ncbi:MAG: acetyltransferase [Porphyromonadaceae bacterium]|nr:acetyltransferase [Porphyromonadaceae bacterium]
MYLYGASGHAKVIIDILEAQGKVISGLIDDNPKVKELLGYPVFHEKSKKSPLIISIGDNKIRRKVTEQLEQVTFETAFHPSAIISPNCTIGEGTVVMQGAIIQSSSRIGNHCIINTAASVDHDCTIEDFVHISPNSTLCGNVSIGEGTWIGAGTVITPGVKIGKWCVIGAGSVVTKNIPDDSLAYGNRCKVIKTINKL